MGLKTEQMVLQHQHDWIIIHTLNEQNKEFVVYFWLSSFINAYSTISGSGELGGPVLTDSPLPIGAKKRYEVISSHFTKSNQGDFACSQRYEVMPSEHPTTSTR
jgi:hypothetical protein